MSAVEGMEFTISNRLDDIYDLEARILQQVEHAGYDENSRFAIRLALDEALINAYKHGNQEDPERKVRVVFQVREDEVEIEIEDEGWGFEKGCLNDPRLGDGLQKTSGRGIFLIRQFMSSLHFNQRGNSIKFTYQKKNDLGINAHGLAHWKFESAEVLELDPVRVERSPTIVHESILGLLDQGAMRIIVDLKFLERIDSSVLGFLVGATREAEQRGAKLILIRAQPEVERIIRATSLDLILNVYADLKIGLEQIDKTR
jgi:serine/threonine-protein kinase RsbW